MSLPLTPLNLEINEKKLDSKQKRYRNAVSKALDHFDSVTEWADYIASLGKLLKALQSWSASTDSQGYYVPFPYQVSRQLGSSLSPELPAGVHQKTLDVYSFIFNQIGKEKLAKKINIWIRGILPLMTYASMSVKGPLIQFYQTYIITLPSDTLKMVIKPILSSLLPGIDDESSEYQSATLSLFDTLKKNMGNDSLFWESMYLIMISSKERRLGALVWLNKKFPKITFEQKDDKIDVKLIDLPTADQNILTNKPGLLIRAVVSCLGPENELLIKRGALDFLSIQLPLNSFVLNKIIDEQDKILLIINCCKVIMNKEMSLNRRIWNWLLGTENKALSDAQTEFSTTTDATVDKKENDSSAYFSKYGSKSLLDGLHNLIQDSNSIPVALNICLAMLDKWELSSLVIPEILVPALRSCMNHSNDETITKSSNHFFDAVEADILWGKIFQYFNEKKDFEFLSYVISTFNVEQDEEILVKHLPLIFLALLSYDGTVDLNSNKKVNRYTLCRKLLDIIPERAFLPLEKITAVEFSHFDQKSILDQISQYYFHVVDDSKRINYDNNSNYETAFSLEKKTYYIFMSCGILLTENNKRKEHVSESADLFTSVTDKIPEGTSTTSLDSIKSLNDQFITKILSFAHDNKVEAKVIYGNIVLFSKYLVQITSPINTLKMLKVLISYLWELILQPNEQSNALKYIQMLDRATNCSAMEAALASIYKKEESILNRVNVLNLLWTNLDEDSLFLARIIDLTLEELFEEQSPNFVYVSKWVTSLTEIGTINKLMFILLKKMTNFEFLARTALKDTDDLEMFTYRLQLITALIRADEGNVLKCMSKEMVELNSIKSYSKTGSASYKDILIITLLNFLQLEQNCHAKSIRGCIILLDLLLDGSEQNFKNIVITVLELSLKYMDKNAKDFESVVVSLLNIVSKVLKLSHKNGIKLEIFDDDSAHLKYIDYLITSVSKMESPMILSSYIGLLLESVIYLGHLIFKCVLPLTNSIVNRIKVLLEREKYKGGYYSSISLLFKGAEELLELAHGYLLTDEKDNLYALSNSKGDFLQSMVANVFTSDSSNTIARLQAERLVILQSFQQLVSCALDIWFWTQTNISKDFTDSNEKFGLAEVYKYKLRTKQVMEKLFLLEPIEILENVIAIDKADLTVSLTNALDGNRPISTVPYLFFSLTSRCNPASTVKFTIASRNSSRVNGSRVFKIEPSFKNRVTPFVLTKFLMTYVKSLEHAAMEEIYPDTILFIKEVNTNVSYYSDLSTELLEFFSIFADKIDKSKFGEKKIVRKELSDLYVKCFSNFHPGSLKLESRDVNEKLQSVSAIIDYLQISYSDSDGSDKQITCVGILVTNFIQPLLRISDNEDLPEGLFEVCSKLSKISSKVKVWRTCISDIFMSNSHFYRLEKNNLWMNIIYEWSQYSDYKVKLIPEILSVIDSKSNMITPTIISFSSSNNSENVTKHSNYMRIAYLLLIAPNNSYLINFKQLIMSVFQNFENKNNPLKASSLIVLRVMLLKFSPSHFNEYWSSLTYYLQTLLQEFLEMLETSADVSAPLVLQVCKTLDLLLTLNIEEFSSTNEWLFVIDTMNCFSKNDNYVALIDELSQKSENSIVSTEKSYENVNGKTRIPLLNNLRSIQSWAQLQFFFDSASACHFQSLYEMQMPDTQICEVDAMNDLFAPLN